MDALLFHPKMVHVPTAEPSRSKTRRPRSVTNLKLYLTSLLAMFYAVVWWTLASRPPRGVTIADTELESVPSNGQPYLVRPDGTLLFAVRGTREGVGPFTAPVELSDAM